MAKTFDDLVKRTTSKATRARAARRSHELLAELLLGELRKLVGKSQQELASLLGIKQPSLSKLEGQSDMQVSTLQRIVEALDGELLLLVDLPRGTVRITQFEAGRGGKRRARPQLLGVSPTR